MKEKNADFTSWRILCALAEKIKAMEPWKQFEDMELFVLHFAQQKPVYCSVMGSAFMRERKASKISQRLHLKSMINGLKTM